MLKVSIVITAYNYEHYVRAAVDSAIFQTYQDKEVIVVDDGSTDATSSILEEYRGQIRYKRISNSGQTKAKNVGAAMATGDLIAFLDADDIWALDKLEKQVKLFNASSTGVVYSRRFWMDPSGKVISTDSRELHRGNITRPMLRDNFICFSSAVIRRVVWEKYGPFDQSLSMGIDFDLWLRYSTHVYFDYCDEPLVYYRTGHPNLSQNKDKRFKSALLIMSRFLSATEGNRVPWWFVRLAYADTYASWAYCQRDIGYGPAIRSYLKALSFYPLHSSSVKGVIWLNTKYLLSRFM